MDKNGRFVFLNKSIENMDNLVKEIGSLCTHTMLSETEQNYLLWPRKLPKHVQKPFQDFFVKEKVKKGSLFLRNWFTVHSDSPKWKWVKLTFSHQENNQDTLKTNSKTFLVHTSVKNCLKNIIKGQQLYFC